MRAMFRLTRFGLMAGGVTATAGWLDARCESRRGRLEGRSTIVTGGASGMGAASARLFAREGAKVAVVDVNGAGAASVVAQIRASGGTAIAVTADLTDEAAVTRA
eukprot:435440-Prymnesium_polylepis.1